MSSETKTLWHPYPQEKPKQNSIYLITVKREDSIPFVCQDVFNDYTKVFRFERYSMVEKIIAWAELPEPYTGNSC